MEVLNEIENDALELVRKIILSWKDDIIYSDVDVTMLDHALRVLEYTHKVKNEDKKFDWYETFSKLLDKSGVPIKESEESERSQSENGE